MPMDRKTENGCEVQDAAWGRNCTMLHIKIFMATYQTQEKGLGDALSHEEAVLRRLVDLWTSKMFLLCAASDFASVNTA